MHFFIPFGGFVTARCIVSDICYGCFCYPQLQDVDTDAFFLWPVSFLHRSRRRKTTESTMSHLQIALNKEKSTKVEQRNPRHPSQNPLREQHIELKTLQVNIKSSNDMITLTCNRGHLELSKYKCVYNSAKKEITH